ECARLRAGLRNLSTGRELNLECRTLTQGRLNPDAPTMHFHDMLGDREPEAGTALRLGVRAVDLMELLKDAGLVLFWNAWTCISHADVEVAVDRLGSYAHLAGVGELDGVTHEVKQHLGEALFVTETNGQRLGHLSLEGQLLVLGEGLRGRANRFHHA